MFVRRKFLLLSKVKNNYNLRRFIVYEDSAASRAQLLDYERIFYLYLFVFFIIQIFQKEVGTFQLLISLLELNH